jgi:exopolysaccharide biosynthesis polyprenyl glycosylphosphotransferase
MTMKTTNIFLRSTIMSGFETAEAKEKMVLSSTPAHWRQRVTRVHGYEFLKRTIDICSSGLGLVLLSPFFALLAVLIKMESPGPVLFSQTRIGQGGALFRCWKFRSMFVNAEACKQELMADNEMVGGTLFKMKRDPRITRVGSIIRKTSIDELPQLWNVFIGDMSLVGPRPPVPQEVATYTPHDKLRLMVKPGITCIWQVSGRSDIPFDQQVQLDVQYILRRSLWTDIWLLLRTIPAVILRRGAY